MLIEKHDSDFIPKANVATAFEIDTMIAVYQGINLGTLYHNQKLEMRRLP